MGAFTQIFTQNTGAVANQVAAGNFAAVTANTVQIFGGSNLTTGDSIDISDVGTPVIEDYDWIQFVHGNKAAADQPIISPKLQVSNIVSVQKAVYAVPVAQVSSVPAGTVPAAGGEAIIRITERANQSDYPHHTFSFSVVFDAGDSYANTDLLTAINASSVPVTASDGGAGVITLTADVAGEPFDVGLDGILTGLTVTESSPADKGTNTAAQILVLEKFAQGTWGDLYVQTGLLGPRAPDSYSFPPVLFADVDTPGTYDTWTVVVKNDNDTDSVARAFSYAEYVIALEDAVTNEAELDAFFASVQVAP
jgi:hypothetical protein